MLKKHRCIVLIITALLLSGCSVRDGSVEPSTHTVKDYDSAKVMTELQDPYILVDYVTDRYRNVIQKTIYNTETKMTHVYNYFYAYVEGYFVLEKVDTIVVDNGQQPYLAE